MKLSILLLITLSATIACSNVRTQEKSSKTIEEKPIIMGAEQYDNYIPLLKNKRVALVVNQSSLIKNKHLVDFLLEKGIKIQKIFAPEHGFRGNIDRGKHINNEIDEKTGLPIVSMYGKNRRPTDEQMADVDIMIFDIQDAGARFFTYISSMHEAMEACAKNNIPFLVLDRPNPLGDYVDGPVRQEKFKSFVGMHPIPIVHGLTVGELAKMINGEHWLENGKKCDLTVIPMKNYKHSMHYSLPVKPSPNLPNDLSIRLYPSLCFFEATEVSIGRGTNFPFQVVAYPDPDFGDSLFVPHDLPGMQMNPIQEGKVCYGVDLRNAKPDTVYFTLKYVIDFAKKFREKGDTLVTKVHWFNLLAGNDVLLKQINEGLSEKEIKASWKKDLDEFKKMRKKYF
ncbi:MAG: DUF1343 domain-containing protein [Sulfurovum sp.]|nr:DUF1343 domain-containing protein [Sulfurovum sp.]